MKIVVLGLLALSVISLPAYAQGTRYYGVDHHASFTTPCKTTRTSKSDLSEYAVDGTNCGSASGSYMILFITSKFPADPDRAAQAQQDHSMAAMLRVITQDQQTGSMKRVELPHNRNWHGTPGRAELVDFTTIDPDPGMQDNYGTVYIFSEPPQANVIYVTEVLAMYDPAAEDFQRSLQAVDDIMRSVQFDDNKK